jgi:hypothetical protein
MKTPTSIDAQSFQYPAWYPKRLKKPSQRAYRLIIALDQIYRSGVGVVPITHISRPRLVQLLFTAIAMIDPEDARRGLALVRKNAGSADVHAQNTPRPDGDEDFYRTVMNWKGPRK